MLSRVANSVYWMARYLERADNVARFIDVNARLVMDMGWEREAMQWEPLVMASGDDADFSRRYARFDERSVLKFLAFDTENPNSIIRCVQNARENARTVREVISSEMWEAMNALYHVTQKHSRKRHIGDMQEFFAQVHKAAHEFAGLIENTMSHGEAWHFARVGRLLERADKTARMVDIKYFLLLPSGESIDSPYDTVEWGALLQSVSGFEMYRKQFHRVRYRDVIQFLMLDRDFPRSVRFCVHTAARSLRYITQILGIEAAAGKEMDILRASLENTSVDAVLNGGLHEFIDVLQFNLNIVDGALHTSFFAIEN